MDSAAIRQSVKQIISTVATIPPEEIGDAASLTGELHLDSLSMIEIGVDIDYEFQLGLPEEQMREIDSVDDAVALVERELAKKETPAAAQAAANDADQSAVA